MPEDQRHDTDENAWAADAPKAAETPRAAGYHMPTEWAPHERCLIAWPSSARTGLWGAQYALAQQAYAAVARAIAAYEPVLLVARPQDGNAARSMCGGDIEIVEMPMDDSWLRDSGPIFLTGPGGEVAAADFAFNSWGEKYLPYDLDATIGRRLCEHLGVRRWQAPMVLEGGAITVDGEGTLITTESCLLHPSRNPGLSQAEMEQVLMDYLGVEKVIWLKSGVGPDDDPDTDGHVDGVAAFVGPGRVLLYMVRDRTHPDYKNLCENRRRLETSDARGRELEVIEFDHCSSPVMIGDVPIRENYVNSYFANGALVVPIAGADGDDVALDHLRAIVPDREVVGVPVPVIAYGGGGIHCITQQVPRAMV